MEPYRAKGILRNGHTNSILATSPARKVLLKRECARFTRSSRKQVLDAGDGVRLSAQFNIHGNNDSPTVILMHGWLGCADSLYLLSLGNYLFDRGFNIVRLNFRDHGDSHHLNREMFHSCRIQEVINACIAIRKQFPKRPLHLIGFSLGGNFALRVNAFTTNQRLAINQTIAFCPVIDPYNTLLALENSFLVYRNYFMQRWRTSFKNKAIAFPDLYKKETFDAFKTLRDATTNLAIQYAGFDSLENYLNGYAIIDHTLDTLHAPAHIVLAKDDPIIPWRDYRKLAQSKYLKIDLCDHGGHCGFLEPNLGSPWINQYCEYYLLS